MNSSLGRVRLFNQRNTEGSRLTSPGQGLTYHVLSQQEWRNTLLLNGCGFFVANFFEGPGDIGTDLNSAEPVLVSSRVGLYLGLRRDLEGVV